MSISKTIGTIVASALIGSVTFFLGIPKKVFNSKTKIVKMRSTKKAYDDENLFI